MIQGIAMWVFPLVKGMAMGGSLIIAIGSQNVFVLSNAIRGQHALVIGTLCILIDIVLTFSGVLGLGALIKETPMLIDIASYFGAGFLAIYGVLAFRRVLSPQGLTVSKAKRMTLLTAITTTLAISLLNPHVYLDTVVLLGSIGGQLPDQQPMWFALGVSISSIIWFLTLVIGGKALAPWFKSDKSWQKLDFITGCTMWLIAGTLLHSVL